MDKVSFYSILCSYAPEQINNFISANGKRKLVNAITFISDDSLQTDQSTGVVESADTQDLGSCASQREGSSPFSSTSRRVILIGKEPVLKTGDTLACTVGSSPMLSVPPDLGVVKSFLER